VHLLCFLHLREIQTKRTNVHEQKHSMERKYTRSDFCIPEKYRRNERMCTRKNTNKCYLHAIRWQRGCQRNVNRTIEGERLQVLVSLYEITTWVIWIHELYLQLVEAESSIIFKSHSIYVVSRSFPSNNDLIMMHNLSINPSRRDLQQKCAKIFL
jgi:hypothetical protein